MTSLEKNFPHIKRNQENGRVVQVKIAPDMAMGRSNQILTGDLFDLKSTLDQET